LISVNANFAAAIAEDLVKVAELYEITLANGVTYYYTSHSADISWSNEYTAIPVTRSQISYKMNLESDDVTVTLGNISGLLYSILQNNSVDGANIVIKRVLWDETYAADMEMTIFQGRADIEFNRRDLILHCHSALDGLGIQVPKIIYQEGCNNNLFDTLCTLTRADYAYSGSATADGGDKFTLTDSIRGTTYKLAFDAGDEDNPIEIADTVTGQVGGGTGKVVGISYVESDSGYMWFVEQNGLPFADGEQLQNVGGDSVDCDGTAAADVTFYALGEVEMTSGNNDGFRRMILSQSGGDVAMITAFPNEIENGDTYDVYPGCDGRATESCLNKFNNVSNFNGYLYIPKIESTIM